MAFVAKRIPVAAAVTTKCDDVGAGKTTVPEGQSSFSTTASGNDMVDKISAGSHHSSPSQDFLYSEPNTPRDENEFCEAPATAADVGCDIIAPIWFAESTVLPAARRLHMAEPPAECMETLKDALYEMGVAAEVYVESEWRLAASIVVDGLAIEVEAAVFAEECETGAVIILSQNGGHYDVVRFEHLASSARAALTEHGLRVTGLALGNGPATPVTTTECIDPLADDFFAGDEFGDESEWGLDQDFDLEGVPMTTGNALHAGGVTGGTLEDLVAMIERAH